jgi:hypothetical protein
MQSLKMHFRANPIASYLFFDVNAHTLLEVTVVGVTVRREKALDFSGCNSRPGTGSFHPVAIETAVETNEAVGALDGKGR